jgi:hypothetical protein
MALRFSSPINRRGAMFGILAAGGAAALSLKMSAIAAPHAEKAYAAFFLGQGGYLFSWGIPTLEREARKLGLATDVFSYTDVYPAWTNIVRKRKEGYKVALVGYSLGNTTATYLQSRLTVDLLLAISESSLGRNHPIKKQNTKRSVLWYGPDMLSNAGVHDGFDETNYIDSMHLFMDVDPRVVRGVLDELRRLVAPERREEPIVAAKAPVHEPRRQDPIVAAKAPVHEPIVPPVDGKMVSAPAPAQLLDATSLPPATSIAPDMTCTKCWGLVQSPGAAGPDPWMQ